MEREAYNDVSLNEDDHWWFVSRRAVIQKVLDQYMCRQKRQKVLEIGCGSGGNMVALQKYGEISAMEPDDDARRLANNRKICVVQKGKLPQNIPFDEGFDLICVLDVLEHVEDDIGALQSIKDKLNQGGKLLITVPAYRFLWSAHDVVHHHKRRYRRKELIDLVSESGLTMRYATYFNTFLFPAITAVRIFNNIRKNKVGSDINSPPVFVNNILINIFSSEKLFLPKISFPFGVSILLVSEKIESGKN